MLRLLPHRLKVTGTTHEEVRPYFLSSFHHNHHNLCSRPGFICPRNIRHYTRVLSATQGSFSTSNYSSHEPLGLSSKPNGGQCLMLKKCRKQNIYLHKSFNKILHAIFGCQIFFFWSYCFFFMLLSLCVCVFIVIIYCFLLFYRFCYFYVPDRVGKFQFAGLPRRPSPTESFPPPVTCGATV